MNSEARSKSRPNVSLDEDQGERGLRILARIIARHLIKIGVKHEEKACLEKDSAPDSKDER